MTPQMQQAVKLLTLSNLEMQEYLREEIEKNPLLEQESEAASASAETDAITPVETPNSDSPDGDALDGAVTLAMTI